MLYLSSSNKYDIFETFTLLELQMEELVTFFCNTAMVTNGYLKLDGFGQQMLIRNKILTILAFKRCMNCLRPPASDIVYDGLKYITRFRPSRHQRLWRTSANGQDSIRFRSVLLTDRQTDGRMDGQTDGWTDGSGFSPPPPPPPCLASDIRRQGEKERERWMDERKTDALTYRCTNGRTYKNADIWTDRHTYGRTYENTDVWTDKRTDGD